MAERLVFVRGSGRCGSKTLVNHLGQHPQLGQVAVNEDMPEALLDWTRCKLQARDARVDDATVGAACRAFFAAYCRQLAPDRPMWLQKSTLTAHRLDALLQFWPEARVIYLLRQPAAVVESLINADLFSFRGRQGFHVTVVNSAFRWYNEVAAFARSQAARDPRVLRIWFEDLIQQPTATTATICRFLEIPPFAAELPAGRERYGARFVLSQREREWLQAQTQSLLRTLGVAFRASPVPDQADTAAATPYPERRLYAPPPTLDIAALLDGALQRAAAANWRRLGVFGAGCAAQIALPALPDATQRLVAVLDDDPLRRGTVLAGVPVAPTAAAADLEIDAVVPLSFVYQQALEQRWRRLWGERIPLVPLWDAASAAASTPADCAGGAP